MKRNIFDKNIFRYNIVAEIREGEDGIYAVSTFEAKNALKEMKGSGARAVLAPSNIDGSGENWYMCFFRTKTARKTAE